ncbi:23S rRNA (adenine(2030)-N(6))-methyltransferase RlmJ [Methylobrevis pamukkalensis]|uniref:Ribosomal RNA large subunit methyltransferase J n=1 Tax=Methylobrevis pamukkalensis TaxID=1439726 RepID=A0A1E3H6Q1_9HYPH|nr:23S rRNA (adenine(2030)-N(6))-methyltransferase RlmJ [Methylobrevis pamukkalensis]ODN71466.1 Ribosomal RNA large subunit methyltransferase J [Methylobrevis pamukkalensis]
MNYRHAFHAGNFADVLKHALLARILRRLGVKDGAFRVVDTHAGIGRYDLAGDEAGRTGEWTGGVGRIVGADLPPVLADFLAPWLEVVAELNPEGGLRHYPGSPLIAARLKRRQDTLFANELHPEDAEHLQAALAGERRCRVMSLDGWMAVRSLLPPPERRGLLIVDPPFEQAGEFERLAETMVEAHRRFATGVQMVWYPLKDAGAVRRFHAAVAASGLTRILRVEQWVRRTGTAGPLAGAGLLLVNPPWQLDEEIAAALPALTALLANGEGAGERVDWLVGEEAPED